MKATDTSNDWKNEDAEPVAAEASSSSASAARRLLFGANTVLAILLAAALFAMVNYLSARHYSRTDVSRARLYELSAKSRQLLAGASNRIDAVLFFRPEHALYDYADSLLREYELACPMLHIEHVDPDREQARASELVRKFGLRRPGVIIFSCGGIDDIVNDADLVELDITGAESGVPPRRTGFLGEQAFSTAILHVTQPRVPVVYFLLGHGERDPRDHDKFNGFSGIARAVAGDHIETRTLMLTQSNAVPADADAVVIAGPDHKFAAAEVNALRRYLARSGRMLLTLDASGDGGLSGLLEEWGVRIGKGLVADTGGNRSGTDLFINNFAAHPVTAPLTNITVVLHLPRPLEAIAASGADKPKVTPLLFSPATSWAETDLENKNMKFDAGQDRRGPLPVALAVEKGPVAGVDIDIRPTRLVVIGDTTFAVNNSLVGGNPDLFLNAINWLLDRQTLLSIAAKPVQDVRLVMDRRQLSLLFAAVVVAMPALVALAGALMWLRRRT